MAFNRGGVNGMIATDRSNRAQTTTTTYNIGGQVQNGSMDTQIAPVAVTGGGKGSHTTANVTMTDHGSVRGALDLAGQSLDNNTFLALAAMDGYAGAAAMSRDMSSAAFEQSASVANRALDTVGGVVGDALGSAEYLGGRAFDTADSALYYGRENNKDFLSGVVGVVKDALGFADRSQDRGYEFARSATRDAMDYSLKSVERTTAASQSAMLESMRAQRDASSKALESVTSAQRDAQSTTSRALEQAAKLTRSDDTDTSQTMIKWIAGALITAAVAWALPKMMKRA